MINTDPHIVTSYDEELASVHARLTRMGGLVQTAIHDAAQALESRDDLMADAVRERDDAIDALEEDIHTHCARLLALRQPTAVDLRRVLTLMRIATRLERCGDYAKNIAKRSVILSQMAPVRGSAGSLRRMSGTVEQLLHDALASYAHHDAVLAAQVRQRDQEVDQIYTALFREFLTHMMEDPRQITAAMHLHFIAKNIERMGDHATGIAEQTIYLVTGELPADARAKGALPGTALDEDDGDE